MTKAQKMMTLIEARQSITHAEALLATGWSKTVVNAVFRRLIGYGVVCFGRRSGETRRCYRAAQ
jgi:DNA-binding transcriptional regulator GbsR (MarR family)